MFLEPARRKIEKTLLSRFFPDFRFDGEAVRGTMICNSGRQYQLTVSLGQFPIGPPSVMVVVPTLRNASGKILGEGGASSGMHHLGRDASGALRLCLASRRKHDPRDTLYKSLLKSRLWLEAYEAHLRTGNPIDELLAHEKN